MLRLVSMSGNSKSGVEEFSISEANMDYDKLLNDQLRERLNKLSPKDLDKVLTIFSQYLQYRDERILKERGREGERSGQAYAGGSEAPRRGCMESTEAKDLPASSAAGRRLAGSIASLFGHRIIYVRSQRRYGRISGPTCLTLE